MSNKQAKRLRKAQREAGVPTKFDRRVLDEKKALAAHLECLEAERRENERIAALPEEEKLVLLEAKRQRQVQSQQRGRQLLSMLSVVGGMGVYPT